MYLIICLVCDDEFKTIKDIFESQGFKPKIFDGSYNECRSLLLNSQNLSELNLLRFAEMKSQRYEIFCIAKRFKLQYGVIFSEKLEIIEPPSFNTKHDNPLIVIDGDIKADSILELIKAKKLKTSFANRKKISPSETYISDVKNIITKINKELKIESNNCFVIEAENQLAKMINLSPIELGKIEECYKTIISEKLKNKSNLS
ncbi:hypothetical protein SLOPH_1201 [Spraguea lophii 42_110]|uniref:Uncharacterized protein n=1 Tax=Spraguea lophii (strain 42_110) TaxID=1358809 RepID=S7W832_SPRLO|nr:hypothetical protein SLOPH_1201 [Spraguea lophii 42_110]